MTTLPSSRRRGFTFVEVLIAAAMLAVLLGFAGQLLVQARRNARMVDQRALALRTVENALEELSARPWREIDEASIKQFPLPSSLVRRWPQAKFTGAVVEEREPERGKRLSVELRLSPNQPALAAKLTAWVYPAAEVEGN
jgi:prepilin-type N-terminal cleavage/methylation domain-containing protein